MRTLKRSLLVFCVALATCARGENVFPGESWERKNPGEMSLKGEALEKLAGELGGRGCIIKDGYVVHEWGDQAEVGDWFSSAKPVLSTLLFFAVEEGKAKSVDQLITDFGWELAPKDRTMTFRHLGAMTSGYARPEKPGDAYSYNDFAINLYQKTLFDKVFQEDPKQAAENPNRLGALGLQDGLKFRESNRRLYASVRDFSRIVWFWLNRGKWGDRQVLPQKYFDEYMKPQVPFDLPNTVKAETNDYLGIGSYGGDSDHFIEYGPGIYGFNWWFNAKGRMHPDAPTWPDAPADLVMSLGARGNSSAILPSQNLILVCAEGNWGKVEAGESDTRMNRNFKTLMEALKKDETR